MEKVSYCSEIKRLAKLKDFHGFTASDIKISIALLAERSGRTTETVIKDIDNYRAKDMMK